MTNLDGMASLDGMAKPKTHKNGQNPQDTCFKIPGRVFSEVGEAPQAAPTQTQRAWGPEIDKNQ